MIASLPLRAKHLARETPQKLQTLVLVLPGITALDLTKATQVINKMRFSEKWSLLSDFCFLTSFLFLLAQLTAADISATLSSLSRLRTLSLPHSANEPLLAQIFSMKKDSSSDSSSSSVTCPSYVKSLEKLNWKPHLWALKELEKCYEYFARLTNLRVSGCFVFLPAAFLLLAS